MRSPIFAVFFALLMAASPLFAQEEGIEKEPRSPFKDLNSLYLKVENIPPRANFGYPDIERRFKRRLGESLPNLKVVEDEYLASGIMNLTFPGEGAGGEVAMEVFAYEVSPATGEAELVSLWREGAAYNENMRKFFFFSEILEDLLGKFVAEYDKETEEKKKPFFDYERPELTKDRLEVLGPSRQ